MILKKAICAIPGCSTPLNMYNRLDICSACSKKVIKEIIKSNGGLQDDLISVFLREHERNTDGYERSSEEGSFHLFDKYQSYIPRGRQGAE